MSVPHAGLDIVLFLGQRIAGADAAPCGGKRIITGEMEALRHTAHTASRRTA